MKSILSVVGIVLLFTACCLGADAGKAADVFPFVKGRYWLYDGVVWFFEDGDDKRQEKKITGWRSEVVDTAEAPGFKAALLKGHPLDLAWYDGKNERNDSIVILTSQGEFHQLCDAKDAVKTFRDIQSAGVLPDNLIGHDTIVFKYPPKTDDRFGDPEQTKKRTFYCWRVLEARTATLDSAIKGVTPEPRFTIDLTFRTAPDHQDVRFVAGIGIVSYDYVHHGTPGNCWMKLVETGAAVKKPGTK